MDGFLGRAVGVKWVDKGRDFSGWDCWGLVVCLYREVFGITVRNYGGVSSVDDPLAAARAMVEESRQWPGAGAEMPGDVLLWRPLHTGVVVRPGYMVHCLPGCETVVERYDCTMWRSRLVGKYRHAER